MFVSLAVQAIRPTKLFSGSVHGLKNSTFMKVNRLLSMSGGSVPNDEDSKAMYALGVNIARQVAGELKGLLSKEEIANVVEGFSDSLLDKSGDERELLTKYGPALNEVLTGRAGKLLQAEKKKGEDFRVKYLLTNSKAVQTSSGLIYNEIIAGTGSQPTVSNTVEVHYHGTLVDGTVFDSSVDRGETIKFPLKNVIKGWQEGVSLMKEGGKATLVVPSELAYGDNGSPPTIPGGSTLVFEVQLIKAE